MPAQLNLNPSRNKSRISFPDATPELLKAYAVNDQQMLFAAIRYNRILQLFAGIVCWHLQSNVVAAERDKKKSRILMDELYVGIDSYGHHHAILLVAFEDSVVGVSQLRRASDHLRNHFPRAHHGLIALEPIGENAVALFGLKIAEKGVVIDYERQYQFVKAEEMVA